MMKMSEAVYVVGNIDPDAYAESTVTSGWIDASDFDQYMAIVQAGDLGSSATLDAKIEGATDSGGTGAADVTSLAITQLTQAGTDSNKQVVINIEPAALSAQSFTHFRLSMTVATATSDCGGIVLAMGKRSTASVDATTVDEIVG